MKQWEPIPVAIIEQVDNERKTAEGPASTIDGFSYAWLKSHRGAPLSQRQLAAWAGWSKRRAATVLNAVREAEKEWADQKRTKNAPAAATQNGPVHSNDSDNLRHYADHERTTNGPVSDQKCTDRAGSSIHNYTTITPNSYVGITSDHTPPEPQQKKPKKPSNRGKNIGTEATRALWAELNERRKQRNKGTRALKLTPEINRALKEALGYANPAEVLHAYDWYTQSHAARWWQEHGCDLSTFCRKKHLGQFINSAAEWTPETDHQTNSGPDLMDLDESQFDEEGNVIHFDHNRG